MVKNYKNLETMIDQGRELKDNSNFKTHFTTLKGHWNRNRNHLEL